jgi:hypothetical protein
VVANFGEGFGRAIQMVAMGLERGESQATIEKRLLTTGAVSSPEELATVWSEGLNARSFAKALQHDEESIADAARGEFEASGAGSLIVTVAVEIISPEGDSVFRHVQITGGIGLSAAEIEAEVMDAANDMLDRYQSGIAPEGSRIGEIIYQSVVGV